MVAGAGARRPAASVRSGSLDDPGPDPVLAGSAGVGRCRHSRGRPRAHRSPRLGAVPYRGEWPDGGHVARRSDEGPMRLSEPARELRLAAVEPTGWEPAPSTPRRRPRVRGGSRGFICARQTAYGTRTDGGERPRTGAMVVTTVVMQRRPSQRGCGVGATALPLLRVSVSRRVHRSGAQRPLSCRRGQAGENRPGLADGIPVVLGRSSSDPPRCWILRWRRPSWPSRPPGAPGEKADRRRRRGLTGRLDRGAAIRAGPRRLNCRGGRRTTCLRERAPPASAT